MVLLTGNGRAFSAGTDLLEMHAMSTDPDFVRGEHGFLGLLDALVDFPKPLVCAVNGLGLGIGATILGYADLAFMSSHRAAQVPLHQPRGRAGGGVVVPLAAADGPPGRGLDAAVGGVGLEPREAKEMGLVWRVCEPEELLPEARRHAEVLAARPISSLIAVKRTMTEPLRAGIAAARERENAAFAELMGGPANLEALDGLRRGPRAGLHVPSPRLVNVSEHRSDPWSERAPSGGRVAPMTDLPTSFSCTAPGPTAPAGAA